MKTVTLKELKEGWRDLHEFKYNGDSYRRSTDIRDTLNKLFSAKIKAAFVDDTRVQSEDTRLDWSGCTIIIVNAKEQTVFLTNSEWADFTRL